jgi:hypothetical protein
MLDQLRCGFLSGVSITFLKDTDGPLMHVIELDELIVTAFFLPVHELLANFSDVHFLSPASKARGPAA